jgi:glycosyltransferase involved in cell wall biosynthesis
VGAGVAVVVPCFNSERFVHEAVSSALAQEGDLEVIVVDDGSTDDSATIVQSMTKRDERVKLLRGPNEGPAHARNLGVRAMSPSNRYVLFLDADDVLAPGAVDVLKRRLEREPTLGAVLGSRSRIDHTGTLLEPAPIPIPAYYAEDDGVRRLDLDDRIGYWHILPINPISTPGQCLLRVSDLPPGELFDERYAFGEDWEMWLRLARRRPIGVEHHEVISYRDHHSNASKRYRVGYEQRAAVYRAQIHVVTLGERARFRAAWRFGMFRYDAGLCRAWAQERFAERDVLGSGRYLLRSMRYETRYLWAVARGEPDVDVMRARSV